MALGTRSFGDGPVGVGIIGAGNISDQYLSNLTTFPDVRVIAVADLIEERAKAQAEKYGVPRSGGVDTVLGDPEIDIVVNLTIPAVHVEVSEAIIAAGKHVWTEKPIGVSREESRRLLEKADAAGLRVGVAPDTVLGPGVQTAKRAIARGDIGRPLFAQTTFQWQGPEIFHPNPAFLYAKGGGPLLDMGPYYVSALVHVFGPVASVAALGLQGTPTRRVQVGELAGQEFPVEIPSTLSVLMDFEEGGQAQSLYSTDSPVIRQGIVEITGTEGTIVIPDPNTFGGAISITRPLTRLFIPPEPVQQEIVDVEQEGVLSGRGVGLLDMARSIAAGRPHVATGEFGYHVLDTLLSIEEAAESRDFVTVESSLDQVGSIAADFDPFASTL
jgi:predicted dehydrogenase